MNKLVIIAGIAAAVGGVALSFNPPAYAQTGSSVVSGTLCGASIPIQYGGSSVSAACGGFNPAQQCPNGYSRVNTGTFWSCAKD